MAGKNAIGRKLPRMDAEFPNSIVTWFLRRMAHAIGATEAFAFGIRREGAAREQFPLIAHIRPGNAPDETLRAARNAFIELANPCIREGKNAAIRLCPTSIEDRNRDPQFGLIVLVPASHEVLVARAMFGFIARFPDQQAAKAALKRILIPPDEPHD